jgi:hypothetical protein
MSSTNLSELIYEPVNADYGWGKYGEFRVLIRAKDGWINVTKLCSDGNRKLNDWSRQQSSESIMETFRPP